MSKTLLIAHAKSDIELFNYIERNLKKPADLKIVGKEFNNATTSGEAFEAMKSSDAIVFLFTMHSASSEDFLHAYKIVSDLIQTEDKLIYSLAFGDIFVPPILRPTILAHVKNDKKRGELINKIESDVYPILLGNKYSPRNLGEIEYLEGLFLDIRNILSHGETPLENRYFMDMVNEFLGRVDKQPDLLNSPKYKEIYDLVLPFIDISNDLRRPISHYLIKLNSYNWIVSELKPGYVAKFNTHDLQNLKRVEYDLYHQLLPGDLVLGYVFHDYKSINCIFEITKGVYTDSVSGEVIELRVKSQILPVIPLVSFKHLVDFAGELGSNRPLRLFKLTDEQFNEILTVTDQRVLTARTSDKTASYVSDINFSETQDQLAFKSDVDSFATIISLRRVNPPMAIGLFGKWGSGKSFFMEKLCERIGELSKKTGDQFVKHVVHVKFNSWHYSDGNLWASLITHIFESLNDYVLQKKFNEDAIQEMYSKMEFIGRQKKETNSLIEKVDQELEQLNISKKELELIIADKKNKLSMLSNNEIFKIVLSDPDIRVRINKINSEHLTDGLVEDIADIEQNLNEISSATSRFRKAFLMLYNGKGNWWKVWVYLGLISLVIYLLGGPFSFVSDYFYAKVTLIVASIATFFQGWKYLRPYVIQLDNIYTQLRNVKEAFDHKVQKIELNEEVYEQKLNREIQTLTDTKQRYAEQFHQKEEERVKLEEHIHQIATGKVLATFLAGKSADDNYLKHLGIISMIRRDFSQLDELFRQQRSITPEEDAEGNAGKIQIDRIVLYIDDLDRCNSDIVVKTLEAIHLLLAFELFVVVVGVDPRWLNNALTTTYGELFHMPKNEVDKTDDLKSPVTSYDYLEKIFQIPFALKPMDRYGRNKLIAYLTKDDLETVEQAQPEIQSSNPSANRQEMSFESIEVAEEKFVDEEVVETDDRITLSEEEINAMQGFSVLFGSTPRTIKRYINIYRIIKAHKGYKTSENHSVLDYVPTMFLLAVVVGCPEIVNEFMDKIYRSDDVPLQQFISNYPNVEFQETLYQVPHDIINTVTTTMLKENLPLIARFSFRRQ
ncbi:P-loop NTPase fold protein [Pedobacter sp.]|jgi:hypothetical protein|uniref:P-loop NTPase fold protein n=1 Tax=Pedobacter sp. TaxID=1411316 RepID=UPI002B7E106B|nr:P-loop NTPase fold protein [Pedobacter sp.]HWW37909.1 P-loop NTPase fold protein [Pedobacter sp.]